MSLKAVLLFLSFLASVSALTTPHAHRAVHHHILAERIAKPELVDAHIAPVRRRSNGKRCKPRPSSVAVNTSPTSTSIQDPLPTPSPQSYNAPKPPSPSPTTSHHVAQEPSPPATTTHQSSPTPPATTKAPSSPSSNLPSFMTGTQTGQGTWYDTGLGACGITNQGSDFIAAASHDLFDNFPGYKGPGSNPNNNPICGRKVTAKFKDNQVTVMIVDRCTGCKTTDLDFSKGAFERLGDPGLGRIDITWTWD